MGERDFARSYGVSATNYRTGGTTVVGLTKGAFLRDLIKFGSETMNFVNRNELCGARWRK